MALPHDAMGLSAVSVMVFPDHTHLLFLSEFKEEHNFAVMGWVVATSESLACSLISDFTKPTNTEQHHVK